MDVYISEEYVARRRAEKRAAARRAAMLADNGSEEAKTGTSRWTAAWAKGAEKELGNANATERSPKAEDVILAYLSA
ncbi:hypothetical protein BRADI_3g30265v3 [Brachypodium distachyon]|uniref:Uncharacterized protein n=1 Tax=Brachypodium distachyon TaxID=15368 RepID=I1I576_BRADI|nr:hypothetical protein BRADI_3g30265v3 [Brachypodium distachyon]